MRPHSPSARGQLVGWSWSCSRSATRSSATGSGEWGRFRAWEAVVVAAVVDESSDPGLAAFVRLGL